MADDPDVLRERNHAHNMGMHGFPYGGRAYMDHAIGAMHRGPTPTPSASSPAPNSSSTPSYTSGWYSGGSYSGGGSHNSKIGYWVAGAIVVAGIAGSLAVGGKPSQSNSDGTSVPPTAAAPLNNSIDQSDINFSQPNAQTSQDATSSSVDSQPTATQAPDQDTQSTSQNAAATSTDDSEPVPASVTRNAGNYQPRSGYIDAGTKFYPYILNAGQSPGKKVNVDSPISLSAAAINYGLCSDAFCETAIQLEVGKVMYGLVAIKDIKASYTPAPTRPSQQQDDPVMALLKGPTAPK